MSDIYVQRDLENSIQNYLKTPEILVVLGPRQSGKSTLMNRIVADLPDVNVLSFEDVDTLALFENDIKTFYQLHVKDFKYVFIDEIQYALTFGKKMKYLYDRAAGRVKFLVTGSSVNDFYLKGLKYLVGRALTFYLYPFSFKEFLRFKHEKIIPLVGKKELQAELQNLLREFVIYGGYPRVVISANDEEKRMILKSLYNLLIQREITTLAGLLDQQKVIKLIRLLTIHNANLLNFSSLSKEAGITLAEVKHILFLFKKTFIVNTLEPYYSNKKLEIVKNPKLYFIDNGLRNAIMDNFSDLRSDIGVLYESYVYQELIKQNLKINFWRTKAKTEVDFVVQYDGRLIPIEVKMNDSSMTRSFKSFIQKYNPHKAFLFNLKEQSIEQVNSTRIEKRFLSEIIDFKNFLT